MMNILIIGGTRFQGRYLVKELLDAGHAVTVFHRGSHAIDWRNRLTDIIGDRNNPTDLARLADAEYDYCIDTCAYFPGQITLVADTLNVLHYCLISTVYVYEDRDALLSENALLLRAPKVPGSEIETHSYGALKVLCEEEAQGRFGASSLILRPSIVIGVGDHTERLLFWLRLAATHGKRLDIDQEPIVQLVDVRDLTHFTAMCVFSHRQGVVNVCGEPVGLTSMLDSIETITGRKLLRRSVKAQDLARFDLFNLPYCDNAHHARYDTALSRSWGFTSRKLRDSLVDIYAYSWRHGFAMNKFKGEELAVLSLFT